MSKVGNDPMPAKGSRFVVEFKGIDLPAEAQRRIAAEIQQVVVRNLAGLDLKGDFKASFPSMIRPRWWGIWIEPTVLHNVDPTQE